MASMNIWGCCCCNLGSVIPRWENVSKVRPSGDSGGTHYTSAPFPRTDPSACGTTPHDVGSPAGSCGFWLAAGDLNGVSAQEIDATVDDIMACAADDSTHVKKDQNCYVKSGSDTVDMRVSKLFGFQTILARKFHHGQKGFLSSDFCGTAADAADETTYLTAIGTGSYRRRSYYKTTITTYIGGVAVPPGEYTYEEWLGTSASKNTSVNRYSGMKSDTSAATLEHKTYNYAGVAGDDANGSVYGDGSLVNDDAYKCGIAVPSTPSHVWTQYPFLKFDFTSAPNCTTDIFSLTHDDSNNPPIRVLLEAMVADGASALPTPTSSGWTYSESIGPDGDLNYYDADVTITRTNTRYEWDVTVRHSSFPASGWNVQTCDEITYSGYIELSDAYTKADLQADIDAALAEWDMSDMELAHLRSDETLALAPCVMYDEVKAAASPMDDFGCPIWDYSSGGITDSAGKNPGDSGYVLTWPEYSDYIDPLNYIWKITSGPYAGHYISDPPNYEDFASQASAGTPYTAEIITPLYNGSIISHTQAGSDRHFWFGYANLTRQFDGSVYQWLFDTNGGTSDSQLPAVTLRWLNGSVALYDPTAERGDAPVPPGNYPQAFGNYFNRSLIQGKYVQAVQTWPAANFGRPCGPDKYAVDQPTVCSIVSGSAPSFVVKKTGNANAPLATGGLAVSDYILHEVDGIYQISGITDNMDGTFTVAVGSLIDTLPTGYTSILHEVSADSTEDGTVHLGTLLFPTYPGICGRVAVTASWASGTLTITSATALPYLRDIIGAGISVDLYDAAMTSGTKIAAAALTRVDDTHWTTPLVSAPAITVAYMTGAGVDYTKYKTTSQRTGVKFAWTFDNRSAQLATGSQPDWYGGSGAGTGTGVVGCTACAIDQFNYELGACKAIVGIVPFYGETPAPVESFSNQELFASPDTITADNVYGGHWQSEVRLTMPDPFWQAPYKPDGDGSSFTWTEDDGSGLADTTGPDVKYYAHRPLVESLSTLPSGCTLPSNVNGGYLIYDSAHNTISPPYYVVGSGGYPIADASGNYDSYETDWGFASRVKANSGGRFSSQYGYVNTSEVP